MTTSTVTFADTNYYGEKVSLTVHFESGRISRLVLNRGDNPQAVLPVTVAVTDYLREMFGDTDLPTRAVYRRAVDAIADSIESVTYPEGVEVLEFLHGVVSPEEPRTNGWLAEYLLAAVERAVLTSEIAGELDNYTDTRWEEKFAGQDVMYLLSTPDQIVLADDFYITLSASYDGIEAVPVMGGMVPVGYTLEPRYMSKLGKHIYRGNPDDRYLTATLEHLTYKWATPDDVKNMHKRLIDVVGVYRRLALGREVFALGE